MADLVRVENLRNGIVLGAIAGALLLWGSYIKEPILKFINGIIPALYQWNGFTASLVVILFFALVGLIVDRI